MKFKGVAIFVDDVNKAIDFYQRLFSIKPVQREEKSASFVLNGVRFFIHKKMSEKEGAPANQDHFEFEVVDVDKEVEKLKKLNFKLEIKPKNYYWGYSAYLRDTEGRMVEITAGG